jgi:hypothetical protein
VLVWDGLPAHKSAKMRAWTASRPWLRVYQLPGYAPELNPTENIWSSLKRSMANLAPGTITDLVQITKNRLKGMQYKPSLIDGFLGRDRTRSTLTTRNIQTLTPKGQYIGTAAIAMDRLHPAEAATRPASRHRRPQPRNCPIWTPPAPGWTPSERSLSRSLPTPSPMAGPATPSDCQPPCSVISTLVATTPAP